MYNSNPWLPVADSSNSYQGSSQAQYQGESPEQGYHSPDAAYNDDDPLNLTYKSHKHEEGKKKQESEFDHKVEEEEKKLYEKKADETHKPTPNTEQQGPQNFFMNEELMREQEKKHKKSKKSDDVQPEVSIEDMISEAIEHASTK